MPVKPRACGPTPPIRELLILARVLQFQGTESAIGGRALSPREMPFRRATVRFFPAQ